MDSSIHFKVLKIRLALRKTGEYRGIADCAKKLYATDGFRVFFRGYVPNILGILPYAGIDLTVYETLKRRYLASHVMDGSTPPAYSLLAFGTFSSCCGQVICHFLFERILPRLKI
jgi:solute carrier family 25 phosphate transporter 23/24/25/41